jgi:hypothetical protein
MKLDEVIIKQKLDEVPASGLGAAAKSLGARVLNKLPSAAAKSKAGNLAGQADLAKTANNLHKEFNTYLGTQGKTMKTATGEELAAFLKTKNHKTAAKIPSGTLQKAQLDQVLMTVSKEAMSGQGGTAPAQTQQPAQDAPVDKNKDGKDDKTGKPIQQKDQTAAKPKVPADLLAKLQKLTPEEKKQLASLL